MKKKSREAPLCLVVGSLYDLVTWATFCILYELDMKMNEYQIAVMIHTEMRKIRRSLSELHTHKLILRDGNGLWRVNENAQKNLLARIEACQQSLAADKPKALDNEMYCATCRKVIKFELIFDQLMLEEQRCPSCSTLLLDAYPDDNYDEDMQTLDALHVQLSTMSSE